MKLTILKEKFKKGFQITERATSKSITLPILNNVLFETEKNFLTLFSTDLEIGIKWWGLAKIEKEGKILIPTKLISSLLSFLPEKPILIEKVDNFTSLSCENFLSKIKTYNPEEFPIIPKTETLEYIPIPSEILVRGLKKVINFPSPSATRPEISGIYFVFSKKSIKLVATDSFRLGEITVFLPKDSFLEKEISVILPQRAAKEMVSIFGGLAKDLRMYINPTQFSLESEMEETPHPEIFFVSRLIEGEFPDYQAIIPSKFGTEVILPKEDFLKQVKAASVFSGKNNEVKFKINPKEEKIEITSENPEFGSYSSFLKGDIKGKSLTISFNHRFLIEGIDQIEDKEFSFQLTDEEGPALIKPIGREELIYILMPIKAS